MVQAVSAKQNAIDVTKSIDAVNGILSNAQAQSTRMSEKLVKVAAQEKIQDAELGNRIDVNA